MAQLAENCAVVYSYMAVDGSSTPVKCTAREIQKALAYQTVFLIVLCDKGYIVDIIYALSYFWYQDLCCFPLY